MRKTILVIAGMLLGVASIFGATTTRDPNVAIVYITIALAGLAVSAPVWVVAPVRLIAPRQAAVGAVGSIMNFANNIMSIAAPIVAGYVVAATGSFTNVFLIGGRRPDPPASSRVTCFLLGRIEPIPDPSLA